jgi:acyl carrier protein
VYTMLMSILVNDLQMRAQDVTPTATCVEVGLDSLTVVELSGVLSSRLGIEIHDYELLELGTVGAIACLMEERCLAGEGEPALPHP